MAQHLVCQGAEGLGCSNSAPYVPLEMSNWESKSLSDFSPDPGIHNLILMKGALGPLMVTVIKGIICNPLRGSLP